MKTRATRLVVNIYSPLLVLALWEMLSRSRYINDYFFPPPSTVFLDIYNLFRQGILLHDIFISLIRIALGFLMGGIPALLLGIGMARSKYLYHFLHPLITLTFPIPKIAIIPFIVLLLGLGELSKITIVSFGSFFLILLNTCHGVSNIDKLYFDIARVYNYKTYDIWRYVIFPGAMPSIFNGIKLANAVCLILLVAAEFAGSSHGIGYRIWVSWETFQITHMYSALFVLAALGWILNTFWEKCERLAMPWKSRNLGLNNPG